MADYDPTTENETFWEDHGIDHDDDDDDDDDDDEEEEVETTRPFQPGAASTPYQPPGTASDPYHGGETHEMSNLDPEHDEGPSDLMPLLEEFVSQEDRQAAVDRTINFIKGRFKLVDFKKIRAIGWGNKPENRGKIVHSGIKGGKDRILKKMVRAFLNRSQTSLKKILAQVVKNYLPKRIKKSEKHNKG